MTTSESDGAGDARDWAKRQSNVRAFTLEPLDAPNVSVADNNGRPGTELIVGEAFNVMASWILDQQSSLLLGGEWHLDIFAEPIGYGSDAKLGFAVVPLSGDRHFSARCSVRLGEPGIFELVTVLTHYNFGRLTTIAAIARGPILTFR
ncbi:hypothetical protein [Actinoplanes aureus]|uniref:Uncharacterized protein n=1 Tax=Actinoplanes aureus TaxID=2792083 RepID=A0A931G2M7_9ACTN|nr:hypothetical protein [Actinoplanes aureus]MBG0569248.1 hypothetical protein [Actinoplanes aureus]